MFYGLTKDYLSNLIPQRQYRTTRQSDQIPTILCHSQAHFQDFLPATIRDWNELPLSMRQTTSPSSFKALLNENQIKPPFYYNTGNRLSQILHARLRNNCAIRAHLYNKNLIDNPYCACGQIETTEHFLFYCNRYSNLRDRLLHSLPHKLSTNLLLFGDTSLQPQQNIEVFRSMHRYIHLTKRFSYT